MCDLVCIYLDRIGYSRSCSVTWASVSTCGNMAGPGTDDFSFLTREHAIKVPTRTSVEKCSLAVGGLIGHENILSASRMNNAVVLFLRSEHMAHYLIEQGIVVDDEFITVLPLSSPAKKVILSNVPPFISDEILIESLARYGKLVSQIKKIAIATTSTLLKHVVSFRRSVYMLLKEPEIDMTLNVKTGGFNYAIFVTSKSMKCFGCGQVGHLLRACPQKQPGPKSANQLTESSASVPTQDSGTKGGNDVQTPQGVNDSGVDGRDNNQGPSESTEGNPLIDTVFQDHSQNSLSGDDSLNLQNSDNSQNLQGTINVENTQSNDDPQNTQDTVDSENTQSSDYSQIAQSSAASIPDMVSERTFGKTDDEDPLMDIDETLFKKPGKRRRDSSSSNKAAKKAERTGVNEIDAAGSESDYSSDCSVTYSVPQSGYSNQTYTVDDIKSFLQKTKHKHKVRIEVFFPDIEQFIEKTKLYKKQGLFADTEWFRLSKFLTKLNVDNDDA